MTDPKKPAAGQAGALPSPADAPPWLPDLGTLQRMANELFRAAPTATPMLGSAGMPAMPAPAGGLGAIPGVSGAQPALAQLTAPMTAAPSVLPLAAPPTAMPAGVPQSPEAALASVPGAGAAYAQGDSMARASSVGGMPSYYFLQPDTMALPADWDPTGLTAAAVGALVPSLGATSGGLPAMPGQAMYGVSAPTPGASMPDLSAFGVVPQMVPMAQGRGDLFDAEAIRRQFPALQQSVHGKPLVWLDNAATTQKPQVVIDRLSSFYARDNSNIHRAAHALAARATDAYEAARESVRRFLNAGSAQEIVFVRGTTEAINLVAQSWGRRHIGKDDEIVLTWLEHHSNIVPWQLLAAEKGAKLKVAPVDDRGQIIIDQYERLLGPRTKLVSITHVSNALGTVMPVREMTQLAHRHGAKVLIDGAQAVSHLPVNLQDIDCDWYALSGHKVFAPTGIGVLRGKPEVLEASPPWQGGGNMISDVTFERTVYHPPPMRFEAGTGNIADAVGLGTALDWLSAIGLPNVSRHEHALLEYGTRLLEEVPGLKIIGKAAEKAGVLSFVIDGLKTEELGGLLDQAGIAVRAGHHCAQPALRRYGLESSVRASLAPYNTFSDLDALAAALHALTA